MAGDEQGRRLLKDLARQVRDKVNPQGAPLLEQRGLDAVDELARELTGPDGLPGLKLWRDAPSKFRLQRSNRAGEITVEWQGNIGALVLTAERANHPRRQTKYLFDEPSSSWRPLSGNGELYQDVSAALVECLYPEVKK